MNNPEPQQFVQIERRKKLDREEFSQIISGLEKQIWENLVKEPIPFGELSGRIAESFLTAKDAPIPDCLTCGVCCASVLCVEVSSDDATSAENFWDITIDGKNGEIVVNHILRREGKTGRCAALKGEIGQYVECSIYETRPKLCRLFDAGSDKCHALRRAFGVEPPLTQMETAFYLMQVFQKDEAAEDKTLIYNAQIRETETADTFEIEIFTNDDSVMIIHRFNKFKESWLEGDFTGLTLNEARNLVASRTKLMH